MNEWGQESSREVSGSWVCSTDEFPTHAEEYPTGRSSQALWASNLRFLGYPLVLEGRAESPGKGFGMHFRENFLQAPVADPGIGILGKKRPKITTPVLTSNNDSHHHAIRALLLCTLLNIQT